MRATVWGEHEFPPIHPMPPLVTGPLPKIGAGLRMLRHKVPDELFAGRRTRPHDLFRPMARRVVLPASSVPSTSSSKKWILVQLLEQYRFTRKFSDPQPLRRQLGGVARADRPCRVIYRLR